MEEYVSDEEVKIEPIDHRLSRRKSKIEEDRKEISTQKLTKMQIQKDLLLQSQNH